MYPDNLQANSPDQLDSVSNLKDAEIAVLTDNAQQSGLPPELNLVTLTISEIFVHSVPLNRDEQTLSNKCGHMTDETREQIQIDLRLSLAKHRLNLRFKEVADTMPDLVGAMIHHDGGDLCQVSQAIAMRVCQKQPGNSTDGILLVARAKCEGRSAIALLKLDSKSSILHQIERDGENVTYGLSQAPSLNIDKKKIFKAALFVASEDEAGNPVTRIVASDHQADGRDGNNIANFFLNNCLECEPYEQPSRGTYRFFTAISESVPEIEDLQIRAEVFTALQAVIESNDPTIQVEQFVTNHVPEDDRPKFRAALAENRVTAAEIVKDTSEIDEAKYISYDLSSGVRIIGPRNVMQNYSESGLSSDGTSVTISGTLLPDSIKFRKRK